MLASVISSKIVSLSACVKRGTYILVLKLSSIFFAEYGLDSATGEINIKQLNPINDVVAPGGATHMAIKAGWSKVDFATGEFDTVLSNVETLAIDSTVQTLNLAFAAPPAGTGCGFQLLHIEFFQEVNGDLYSLKNGSFVSFIK